MRLAVRYAETDAMGIAHHSSFVVWLEAGRVAWLKERGMDYRELEQAGMSLAVSQLRLNYRQAAHFDDELEVHTKLTEVRSRRVRFDYRISRVHDAALLASAETVHTPVNRQGLSIRLPLDLQQRLSSLIEE